MVTATPRKTAEERREEILEAALTEFAAHGFEGASTDTIAREVGISQPYLFRLFGTKKGLYLASAERCLADTYEKFRAASEGLSGDEALEAIGMTYKQMIAEDPRRLQAQMQGYAASDDSEIREVMRRASAGLSSSSRARASPASASCTSSRSGCSSTS